MKKTILMTLVFLGLSLFLVRAYWHTGFPYTHDGENHLARFANYQLALREGQWPPRWAPNLMNHYGYPVFNYNYPLANILSLPLRILKLNYELIFKLQVVSAVLLGLVAMRKWLQLAGVTKVGQWLGTISYATTPYILNVVVYRGNIGELWMWALVPTVLAQLEWWRVNAHSLTRWQRWLMMALGAISFVLVLLAHNVFVMVAAPLLVLYGLWRWWGQWLRIGIGLLVVVWAWLMTLWFWLPAVAEKSMVVLDRAGLSKVYAEHFPTWQQLLAAPLSFGFSFAGSVDSLSFAVGASVLAVVWISLGAWWWRGYGANRVKPSLRHWTVVMSGVTLGMILLQLAMTAPIWELVPLARFVQFPWRLGLVVSLAGAAALAGWWSQLPTVAKRVLVLAVMLQAYWAWQVQPVGYFHKTNAEYEAFPQSTSTANENLPVDFTYLLLGDWQPAPFVFSGSASAQVQVWRGSWRTYQLQVTSHSVIVEQTMYYPGWQTEVSPVEGASYRAEYINTPEIGGRLAYQLQPGQYQVRTSFTQQTWARQWGNGISLLTGVVTAVGMLVVGSIAVVRSRRHRYERN